MVRRSPKFGYAIDSEDSVLIEDSSRAVHPETTEARTVNFQIDAKTWVCQGHTCL